MAIDLMSLTPHKVSRDLRGYSVFFYGEPKSGKTTTAARFPEALLLAFEKVIMQFQVLLHNLLIHGQNLNKH